LPGPRAPSPSCSRRWRGSGGTFTARSKAANTDSTKRATLEGANLEFLAFGNVSLTGDTTVGDSATLAYNERIEAAGSFECGESPGKGTYSVKAVAESVVPVEDQDPIRTTLRVVLDGVVDCVAPVTPTPTSTPTPAPDPTPTPSGTMSDPEIRLGCDHRIPGEESDVIVEVANLQPGETVSGTVTGPGVIGDGAFSATAGDDGSAQAKVPIKLYGSYEAEVETPSGSLSATTEVGEVCTPP
jgi:hypothetical protein